MPEAYRSFDGELGTPMYGVALLPLLFPLASLKAMIHVDDTSKSIHRRADKDSFWNGVVTDVADTWHALDVSLQTSTSDATRLKTHLDFNRCIQGILDFHNSNSNFRDFRNAAIRNKPAIVLFFW